MADVVVSAPNKLKMHHVMDAISRETIPFFFYCFQSIKPNPFFDKSLSHLHAILGLVFTRGKTELLARHLHKIKRLSSFFEY